MAQKGLDAYKFNQNEEKIDTSKKVKVGIIGTGWIAESHVAALLQMPDVEIVSGADIIPGKAQKFFADNGVEGVKCYPSHKELIDASPVAVEEVKDSESTYGVDNMFTGTFTSPYRISHVTVTISDGSGKVVQKSTCYGREEEMRAFDLSRFVQDTEQPSLQGIINLDDLSVGTYRCTFTCEIATGKVFTVRDFEFTK